MSGLGLEPWSIKPTHYLLYYGGFDLVSHTSSVVCVNFIYFQSFCQKFVLMSGLGLEPWSTKPTDYLLYYGGFDLVSHTTYVVCVNFIHKWRDLQFNVDSKRQIFEKLFMAILFTLRVFARNLLRGNRRSNIFRILF